MVINTLKHDYYVIHKLEDGPDFEDLLCYVADRPDSLTGRTDSQADRPDSRMGRMDPPAGRPDSQTNSREFRYRVCRLKNRELTLQLIAVFMELKKHKEFTDFYDCFSKDGALYLVFKHYDHPLLSDKLDKERCSLKERLEIGKNLLTQVLMFNMPDFILYDALASGCVTVSASLDVFFNYRLISIQKYKTIGIADVKNRLAELYQHLFEYEIKKEASEDIDQFIARLQELEFKNYIEIYKEYETLYEKLSKGELIQKIKPHTFLFRLWDRIKGLFKYVRPVLTGLIVLLIAGYLIYTIIHKPVDKTLVYNFDKIGTVTIEGGNAQQSDIPTQ